MFTMWILMLLSLTGVEYEGLFRLSGAASEMKSLKDHFEYGMFIIYWFITWNSNTHLWNKQGGADVPENTDVHVIASTLKQYLRDMSEPLVPYEFYRKFMDVTEACKTQIHIK